MRWQLTNVNGNFTIPTGGLKPGGGPWSDSSDERIKTVTREYTTGLAAIKGLRPVRYIFKGNDTNEIPAPLPTFIERMTRRHAARSRDGALSNSPHYGWRSIRQSSSA